MTSIATTVMRLLATSCHDIYLREQYAPKVPAEHIRQMLWPFSLETLSDLECMVAMASWTPPTAVLVKI